MRWTVEVKSLTEIVLVYADVKGEITGVNLNGTDRMRNLNMYQRPELAAEAAAEVRRQAGNEPILLRVSFYSTMIGFTTTFKDDSYPIASMRGNAVYNWSLNGLQRGTGSLASSSSNPDAPFGVDEVDWDLLPKIVADARTKLEMPNGRVTSINVNKPNDSVGTPVPVWSVYIEQGGERGEYYADVKGVTKTVSLPPSRRKPANWLEPTAIADALGRIVQGFSPDAKFEEIQFYDSYVRITAQDPRKPGELMQVNLRERGLYRWGSVMFPKRREDDFPLQDLRLAKENIAAMLDRTLTELNMPGGRFTDVIIGRHNAEKSRGKGVTVQIRAEAHGVGAGYVVYEADGSVVRPCGSGGPDLRSRPCSSGRTALFFGQSQRTSGSARWIRRRIRFRSSRSLRTPARKSAASISASRSMTRPVTASTRRSSITPCFASATRSSPRRSSWRR